MTSDENVSYGPLAQIRLLRANSKESTAVFELFFVHLLARKPNLEKKMYLFKQILS